MTTTEPATSDTNTRGTVTERENEQHTSLSPRTHPHQRGLAGARVRPRESVAKANTESEQANTTDRDNQQGTGRNYLAALSDTVNPPNPRKTRLPSWQEQVWRARGGRQVAEQGWTRSVNIAWTYSVGFAGHATSVWLHWITENPVRLAATVAVYDAAHHVLPWLPAPTWLP